MKMMQALSAFSARANGLLVGIAWAALAYALPVGTPTPSLMQTLARVEREADKNPGEAEKRLQAICRSVSRQMDKSVVYGMRLRVKDRRRTSAGGDGVPDGRATAAKITRDGLRLIEEAADELHEGPAVLYFAEAALRFVGPPARWEQAGYGVPRVEGERAIKTVAKMVHQAAQSCEPKRRYLEFVAEAYLWWNFNEDAYAVCQELAQTTSAAEPPGYLSLTAALLYSRLPKPNWEECLLTLDQAVEAGGVPDDRTSWANRETIDNCRRTWTRAAREAGPQLRVLGFLTLWQHGAPERISTYQTDRLRRQLERQSRAVIDLSCGPTQIGQVIVLDTPDDDSPTVTAELQFPVDSVNPSGNWVFRLVSVKRNLPAVWLIDVVDRPSVSARP